MKNLTRYYLLPIYFAICSSATAQQALQLNFQVDMTPVLPQIKSKTTVGIRGSQPPLSWKKSLLLQDPDGDGIYTISVPFENGLKGGFLEYKYILDDANWELEGQNRFLVEATNQPVDTWNHLPAYTLEQLPKLSAQAIHEDLRILQKGFTTLHPGLYRYRQPEEIEQYFSVLAASIRSPVTYLEAYRIFSEAAGMVQCGHTYANFFNQSGLIKQLLFEQADKLPFSTRIIDHRLFIEKNAGEASELRRGLEIRKINSIPFADILDQLLPLVKADGSNDAKRIHDLQISGLNTFESFDAYFPLLFPPINGQYTLELYDPERGQNYTQTVAGISRQRRLDIFRERYGPQPDNSDDLWKFSFLRDTIGYLQLGTFATYEMSLDWKKFLQEAFLAMKKQRTGNLIIDVRGNEGGMDEVLKELAKYLTDQPVEREPYQTMTRYQKVPDDIAPYLSSWNNDYKDMRALTTDQGNGFFLLQGQEQPTKIPASKNRFQGTVYLLIDASNSSATFIMAQLFKKNKLATLVGQTTGGSQRGINGGLIAFMRLPNSGIEVDIPVFGSFPKEEKPAGGIVPDVIVAPSVADFIQGIDTELEATIRQIQAKE